MYAENTCTIVGILHVKTYFDVSKLGQEVQTAALLSHVILGLRIASDKQLARDAQLFYFVSITP